ncbi:MAG: alpha-(1-_3)-arabinofuranosyltransferase domain-containing protein, partial [Ilumatobacteraceae bacterium]
MTATRRAMATRRLIHPALLALVAFLPPLWSAPGKIAADTKSYLSINPWGLLQQATQLWDSSTGLGTVTHQTIGYLFPMGPWWAAADVAGIPDWLTQRLWWGALVFTALLGA